MQEGIILKMSFNKIVIFYCLINLWACNAVASSTKTVLLHEIRALQSDYDHYQKKSHITAYMLHSDPCIHAKYKNKEYRICKTSDVINLEQSSIYSRVINLTPSLDTIYFDYITKAQTYECNIDLEKNISLCTPSSR